MCGIAGIIHLDNTQASSSKIRAMSDCLKHRGPDADGFFVSGQVALGHRRLSIIDLSDSANQPFSDPSGRYQIIFNGEIYNFQEIRKMLSEYAFTTSGDTEVLLAAYIKFGRGFLDLVKGMFAFAIYDQVENLVLIARDRIGVKPIYYYHSDSVFVFASEIRSVVSSGFVKKSLNHNAIYEFLSYQSVGGPHTIFNDIAQLDAGCGISIKNNIVEKFRYYDVAGKHIEPGRNLQTVKSNILNLLRQAVQSRMISDVPLGAFLSGGIDSSVIVGLMSEASTGPVNTFNISFEENAFDESSYAEIISKKFNTTHQRIVITEQNFHDDLMMALTAMDSPSGDGVNSYIVSKAVKQAGLTVALSGVGGDELFAGYPFFKQYTFLRKFRKVWGAAGPLRMAASQLLKFKSGTSAVKIQNLLQSRDLSIAHLYPEFRRIISRSALNDLLTFPSPGRQGFEKELINRVEDIKKYPELSQVSIAEYLGYTQHTLLKDMDQMSMAVSLEVREPFFDHELIEYVLSVPDSMKNPEYPKKLLVESVKDLLPNEVVHRKKQGFLFPWSIWMKTSLLKFCKERIDRISEREFVNGKNLQKLWNRFLQNDSSVNWMQIWLFVVLEEWLSKNEA